MAIRWDTAGRHERQCGPFDPLWQYRPRPAYGIVRPLKSQRDLRQEFYERRAALAEAARGGRQAMPERNTSPLG